MPKKRVIIIHHVAMIGGGTKSLVDIATMLSEQYDITICVPGKIDVFHQIIPVGINVVQLKSPVPIWISHAGGAPLFSAATIKTIQNLRKIRQFCKEIEGFFPDLIIFNTIVSSISAPFFKKNIKKICIDRETQVSKFSIYFYKNILENHIDAVGFLAEAEKRKFKINTIRTFLVPDCVPQKDITILSKKHARSIEKIGQDKYVILYMGGSQRIKGPDVALKAINILSNKNNENKYLLIIAGSFELDRFTSKSIIKHTYNISETKYRVRVRRSLKISRKNQNVRFVGNRASINTLICASDIIIFPSTKPHQPRPCIEAGYYSRPVIISDYPETEEYFRSHYNALTIEPENAKSLAHMLEYASTHPEDMKKMGDNNLMMSNRLHDFNRISNDFVKIVNEVIG